MAQNLRAKFYETSAKTNINIDKVFVELTTDFVKPKPKDTADDDKKKKKRASSRKKEPKGTYSNSIFWNFYSWILPWIDSLSKKEGISAMTNV